MREERAASREASMIFKDRFEKNRVAYTPIYMCMYIYSCTFTHMHIHVNVHIHIFTHIHIYL